MKLLGVMGSPRLEGNTDLLLNEVLEGARSEGADAEKILVCKKKIGPCRECNSCLKDGTCFIKDGMVDIYTKLLASDVVIIASPTFFYGVPSQLKALVDRCQPLWARKYLLNKPPSDAGRKGVFIGVGATKGDNLFDGTKLMMKYFFPVIGVEYTDNLLCWRIDQKGDIKEHPTALTDAYELGRKLARG